MARWLAQLEGERLDVEEFTKGFPDGPIFAIEENGAFYLVGSALDVLSEATDVRSAALAALDDYSGVIGLLWSSFHKPKLGPIIREDDDGRRSRHYFEAFLGGRVKVTGTLIKVGEADKGPTEAQQLLRSARANSNLHAAILLWSDGHRTWPRLYRVLEEIERAICQRVSKAGLCSDGKRERFVRSCQVPEVAGLDARHAGGVHIPPPDPMALSEATEFVGRVLIDVLRASR